MTKLETLHLELSNLSKKREKELISFLERNDKVNDKINQLAEEAKREGSSGYDEARSRYDEAKEYIEFLYRRIDAVTILGMGLELFNSKFNDSIGLANKNIEEYLETEDGQKEALIVGLYSIISMVLSENKILNGIDNITIIDTEDNNSTLIIYCHDPKALIGYGNGLIVAIKQKLLIYQPQIKKIKVEKHTQFEY